MGFQVVLQGSIFVLIFGWIAFGPYSAYYHQVLEQVKTPVEIIYHAIDNAITDIYLLSTNPTEWYARQQVQNVRPERAIDYPKGIEAASLDALPPSVPGGSAFALTLVLRNDGVLTANDIGVSVSCNQWCYTDSAASNPYVNPAKMQQSQKSEITERLGLPLFRLIESGSLFYVKDRLERGEATVVTLNPIGTRVRTGREAEAQFAKIDINISYVYSTNSTLKVDIISDDELNRRFREGDTVFKQVAAVGKSSPAQLSLNVGPQPLRAESDALLLVAVANAREKSRILLERGTPVVIRLPRSIGSDLRCGSLISEKSDVYETLTYIVEPNQPGVDRITILPNEFGSIFSFVCSFKTASVETLRTDYITASLPRFIFVNQQKKDVSITPPLGIIFEPYEATCSRCGDGLGELCNTKPECHGLSEAGAGPEKTCYFEDAGNSCHVCGKEPDCAKFRSSDACENEDGVCGLKCSWDPSYVNPTTGVKTGLCNSVAPQPYRSEEEYAAIYGSTKQERESQLVNVNFQGRAVKFHTKAAAALRAVNDEITIACARAGYDFWKDSSGGTYNDRTNVNDPSRLSMHAYGIAIDINPATNPNNVNGVCTSDIPSCAIAAFRKNDFVWGCDFQGSINDAMHFEYRGL